MISKTKQLFYITVLVLTVILSSCSKHDIDGDKVYFVYWNEGSGKNKILIQGADAETFKELKHANYAIDKNVVYYEAGKLKDANPKTFISISDHYGKDNRYAYNDGRKIEGADGNTFEIIEEGPYSKDKKDYYFDTIAMKVSDLKTFKILNQFSDYGYWAKDKNYYYHSGKKYPLADYETFTYIKNGYAKDKLQVYFEDSVVIGADAKTFKSIDYAYGQDKYGKFKRCHKLNIKDPNTFEILQFGFTKDKYHVYDNDTIVKGADPATFEFITGSMWAKDKASYFYKGKRVGEVDYTTFRYLDYHYAIDKNHVYYNDQIIKEADAKTFKHIEGSQDGKDKNGCYRYGEKVDCKVLLTDE